jgi:hypothetical protein
MIELYPIDANDQIIEADLDGETYYVGLSWNETGRMWTLSLRNLGGEVLSSSIPAIPGWPLLYQVRHPSHPPGELCVYLRTDATLDRNAFVRGEASLLYVERVELEAMNAAL